MYIVITHTTIYRTQKVTPAQPSSKKECTYYNSYVQSDISTGNDGFKEKILVDQFEDLL